MGAKTGTKSGRPLKQNGKNKVQENENAKEGPDLSVLRKPVEISVLGLNEALKVFQSCTPELRHLLSYECDVIYECKLCRNLFRSLANFISHKRVYCTQLHNNTQANLKNNKRIDDTTVFVQPEPMRTTRARESCTNVSVCDKAEREVCGSKARGNHVESVPFRITVKKDLTSIVEKLMQKNATETLSEVIGQVSTASEFYDGISRELEERKKEAKEHTVHLEPIDNTSCGVFQTVVQASGSCSNLIKSQVQDLQRIISSTEVILGPDGKVVESGNTPVCNPILQDDKKKKCRTPQEVEYTGPRVTAPESEVELFCNICQENFSSFKSLNRHMKSLHTTLRTFYPCPCCKLPFSNSWSVYRHLLKVHRKTNEQIRKLREKVIKTSFKKEILQTGAQKLSKPNAAENPLCPSEVIYDTTPSTVPLTEEESDKQWFGHQGDGLDLQCCGGCGRRFERRAALLAHSQSCLKLIAAKQNVSNSGRSAMQVDKSAALGRPPIQPNKLSSSVLSSVPSSVMPALWASSLPGHPLNHSIHLNQDKNAVPTKKIEIQVRKDYGKTIASNCEYRTRTPSTSRSEDGAASTGRSDDGMTSTSSETETSGASTSNIAVAKQDVTYSKAVEKRIQDDSEAEIKKSLISDVLSNKHPGHSSETPTVSRRGRPPKKREDLVHMNGVVSTHQDRNSVEDTSDDSVDVLKEEAQTQRSAFDSRKRKAASELLFGNVKEEENSLSPQSNSKSENFVLFSKTSEDQSTEIGSNIHKLQCLVCPKKYKSIGNLKRHLAMHIGWNRYRCIMCEFRCFSKTDCIAHAVNVHLDSWDKIKAAALVQDMQMDAGGSTDIQADSGDSDSMGSDKSASVVPPDSASEDLNCPGDNIHNGIESFERNPVSGVSPSMSGLAHDSSAIDEIGEIISVA